MTDSQRYSFYYQLRNEPCLERQKAKKLKRKKQGEGQGR
jgi:hypothetical protein